MTLRVVRTRYWLPHESGSQEIDGFLAEHVINWPNGGRAIRGAVTSSDLVSSRCLVMLGPPGSGKSTFLEQHQPLLPSEVRAVLHKVDLGLFGSEDRLLRDLAESPVVISWLEGAGELCVLLDGFDEAQQRIPQLSSILISLFERWPLDRLWIRLACRSAEWPKVLDAWVRKQGAEPRIVELAPFRRRDAIEAAADLVDPEAFIAEIERRGLSPLAALPLSLNLLVRGFETAGAIPESRAEIYWNGLRAMCEEPSTRRRIPGNSSRNSLPSTVLGTAIEAAAAMVFSGKEMICAGSAVDASNSDLTLDDLFNFGLDSIPGMREEAVRDLLGSALFRGAGADRLVWSHATFPEFLAAKWCIEHNLVEKQLRSLLVAEDGKVVPRFRRVAAWLISSSPSAFAWIALADPEAVANEIDVLDDALRSAVVEGLLAEAGAGTVSREWGINYGNLRYPGLGAQLRPFLAAGVPEARDLAVQLAIDGRALDLEEDLLAIGLNPAEPEYLRYRSILALIAFRRPRTELIELLENPGLLGADSNRELRGAILESLWPAVLQTSEALNYVNVSPKPGLVGHYRLVITQIAKSLRSDDVEAAVRWLNRSVAESNQVADLREACLSLCVGHLENPMVRDAVVGSVRRRLAEFRPVRGEHGEQMTPWPELHRHNLIRALVDGSSPEELIGLVSNSEGGEILQTQDFPWLIAELDKAEPSNVSGYVELISRLFNPDDVTHANTLASLPEDHLLVTGRLQHWCGSIKLGSPRAAQQREEWQRYQLPRQKAAARQATRPDEVDHWIAENLDSFDQGDVSAYAHALHLITVRPGGAKFVNDFEPDALQHPRWEGLDEQTRQRLTDGARTYLETADDRENGGLPRLLTSASAGAYRAFILLLRTRPQKLEELDPQVWQMWAPGLVFWAVDGNSEADKKVLLRLALTHARAELQQTVIGAISTAENAHLFHAEADLVWDDQFASELARLLGDGLSEHAQAETISLLMSRAPHLARPILTSWLQPSTAAEDPSRAALAFGLLLEDAEMSWDLIREVLDTMPDVAENAILHFAHYSHRDLDLNEDHLAYFYEWTDNHFPREKDPEHHGVAVSPRASAGRLRERLLERIVASGTPIACQVLELMVQTHPDQGWRKLVLSKAQKARRDAEWEPTALQDLRMLGRSRQSRLVKTEDQLADLVREALTDIQDRLTGETPESHLLWDTRVMRPKSEDEVSDYLMHRLRDRLEAYGVVVNREVQVRRNRTTGVPERTDLRIEAFASANTETPPLRVIVEVKGAWNTELRTAIKEQLVGHYLKDVRPARGLYVVLWPDLQSWAEGQGTPEKRRVASLERSEIESVLAHQGETATLLGDPVDVVHLDIPYQRSS